MMSSMSSSVNGWVNNCGQNCLSRVWPAVDYQMSTNGQTTSLKPTNIRFLCKRYADFVDSRMSDLYKLIIMEKAHTKLSEKPGYCNADDVMGHCGNSRGALTECACDSLNRLKSPELRLRYENEVISAAVKICSGNPRPTELNIGVFASGGLHDTEVLLFRLIEKLKNLKFSGNINLFLMDLQYQSNIDKAFEFTLKISEDPPKGNFCFSWDHFIGDRKDLSQFVEELALCLPSTITVQGFVFGDAEEYIQRVKDDYSLRHDLFIGADIEDTGKLFARIKQETFRRLDLPGLALIKDSQSLPHMCSVDALSAEFDCELIRRIGPVAKQTLGQTQGSTQRGKECVIL